MLQVVTVTRSIGPSHATSSYCYQRSLSCYKQLLLPKVPLVLQAVTVTIGPQKLRKSYDVFECSLIISLREVYPMLHFLINCVKA